LWFRGSDNFTGGSSGFESPAKTDNADKLFPPGSIALFFGVNGQCVFIVKEGINAALQFLVNPRQGFNVCLLFYLLSLELAVSGKTCGPEHKR